MTEKERFERILRADRESLHTYSGIGTVSEKRLHRIIKSYVSEDTSTHEIKLGRYVADVFIDGRIYEIQTKAFSRLLPKLKYYFEETPYSVTVIYPIIRNKKIIRIDPETGEILRKKASPNHGKAADILTELYHVRELFPHGRLKIRLLFIDAEEYRYSERVRYRRTGAYDSELFPTDLVGEEEYSSIEDIRRIIPINRESFSASEYSKATGLRGRKLYYSLTFLCHAGLIKKENKTYFLS